MGNSRLGGSSFIILKMNQTSTTTPVFFAPTDGNLSVTEADIDMSLHRSFRIRRLIVTINTMTKASETIIGFRDDGSTVTSITVPASTAGIYDSGVINILVAKDSLVNWVMSGNSGAGLILGNLLLEIEI